MSRPKEFDPQTALDAAMRAFWEHGYAATSLADLTDCMQVQKASLYGTFGDKRSLFLAALRRYQQQGFDQLSKTLSAPGSARARLETLFAGIAAGYRSKARGPQGCLWIKTVLELAPHDEEVAQLQREHMRRVEQLLRKTLQQGVASGEFEPKQASPAAVHALYASILGLHVLGSVAPGHKQLVEAGQALLQRLDG